MRTTRLAILFPFVLLLASCMGTPARNLLNTVQSGDAVREAILNAYDAGVITDKQLLKLTPALRQYQATKDAAYKVLAVGTETEKTTVLAELRAIVQELMAAYKAEASK